jgi:translation initiation factor IF-3
MAYKNYKPRFQQDPEYKRINYQIRVPRVFLIDTDGKPVGEIDTEKAMTMAEDKNLDLVEVSANANPPVCRIMDYGKYQYQRKQQEVKKTKVLDTKEIRLSFKIGEHDKEIKVKRAEGFLSAGHKVKITMMLRGRENIFAGEAVKKMKAIAESFAEKATLIGGPEKKGKFIDILLSPK